MGNTFTFGADHPSVRICTKAIDQAIQEVLRIEGLFTTYHEASETQRINRLAGIAPARVSEEMIGLIQRGKRISQLTQGAFDLSYGSLDKRFWNFDQSMDVLPSKEQAQKAISLIDYRRIEVDTIKQQAFLSSKGMRIGFGGIGKGYAADRAAQVMKKAGIERGFVSASGDIYCWGNHDRNWKIALELPEQVRKVLGDFELNNYAVATSGDYEKCVTIDGVRYSHTIDPKTGFPAKSMKSVTVIAPFAELADALCTPLMIMGPEVGLNMINQVAGVECIIIDQDNNIHFSKNIHNEYA